MKTAKEHKQNVWIIFHIPPGVDAWSTLKEGHTVAYWDALHKDRDSRTFTDKFQELVQTYSPNIKGIFSGHTHMDHFRLIFDKSHNPLAYVHITPAISPQFGNNPGFQVLTYDAVSFSVTDFDTYYYDGAAWKEEYDFDSTYGKAPYDASNLAAIYNHLSDDAALRRSFVDYYDVHNQQVESYYRQQLESLLVWNREPDRLRFQRVLSIDRRLAGADEDMSRADPGS